MTEKWSFDKVASQFDEHIRRSIPSYDYGHEIIIKILEHNISSQTARGSASCSRTEYVQAICGQDGQLRGFGKPDTACPHRRQGEVAVSGVAPDTRDDRGEETSPQRPPLCAKRYLSPSPLYGVVARKSWQTRDSNCSTRKRINEKELSFHRSIIDLGSSRGTLTSKLALFYPDFFILGIDIEPNMIAHSIQDPESKNLKFKCADLLTEEFSPLIRWLKQSLPITHFVLFLLLKERAQSRKYIKA